MPLYSYKCSSNHEFDEIRSVAERETCKCPTCGKKARQQLTAARLDYYNMGVQDGLPTALAKWDKMHRQMAKARRES